MKQLDLLKIVADGLKVAGVDYMLSGSYASTFHGEPRMTQDIDLVVEPNERGLSAFLDQLEGPRFYVGGFQEALMHRTMFNVIDTSSGWKIDLIIKKDRPFSSSEFDRRQQVDFQGVSTWIVSREDAILSKLEWHQQSGSDRQLRDVAGMIEVAPKTIDIDYLEHWAAELGLEEVLESVLEQDRPG